MKQMHEPEKLMNIRDFKLYISCWFSEVACLLFLLLCSEFIIIVSQTFTNFHCDCHVGCRFRQLCNLVVLEIENSRATNISIQYQIDKNCAWKIEKIRNIFFGKSVHSPCQPISWSSTTGCHFEFDHDFITARYKTKRKQPMVELHFQMTKYDWLIRFKIESQTTLIAIETCHVIFRI